MDNIISKILKLIDMKFDFNDVALTKNILKKKERINIILYFRDKYNLSSEEYQILNKYNFFIAKN